MTVRQRGPPTTRMRVPITATKKRGARWRRRGGSHPLTFQGLHLECSSPLAGAFSLVPLAGPIVCHRVVDRCFAQGGFHRASLIGVAADLALSATLCSAPRTEIMSSIEPQLLRIFHSNCNYRLKSARSTLVIPAKAGTYDRSPRTPRPRLCA